MQRRPALQLPCWLALIVSVQCVIADTRRDGLIGYSERSLDVDAGPAGNRVVLKTEHGQIPILLMRKNAPQTTRTVAKLAAQDVPCVRCRFYRNEARPPPGDMGPPYGLLQGGLPDLDVLPPREGNLVARRGHACMIPGTKEFFIAASDHSEWGTAHTGDVVTTAPVANENRKKLVEDMAAVDRMLGLPHHEITHPDYGTVMRMLDAEVAFSLSLEGSH